jgi:hypothetical protein
MFNKPKTNKSLLETSLAMQYNSGGDLGDNLGKKMCEVSCCSPWKILGKELKKSGGFFVEHCQLRCERKRKTKAIDFP